MEMFHASLRGKIFAHEKSPPPFKGGGLSVIVL
jgi:hypothetical protein